MENQSQPSKRILLVSNTAWYLFNFRLSLAVSLRQAGMEVICVAPQDDHSSKLNDLGFETRDVFIQRGGVNPFKDYQTYQQLIKIYSEIRPDIVHHFTSKCVIYGSLAAKQVKIMKVVNSITGMGYVFTGDGVWKSLLQALLKWLFQSSLGDTDIIFQNEDDLKEFIKRLKLTLSKIHLIPSSGVDTQKFIPKMNEDNPPIVILAARLLEDKGVREFYGAARILTERAIRVRMVIVGEPDPGNPTSISVTEIKNWAESNMIEWWGWKDDMVNVFQQAQIACLPSYREGLPKSLIEAAACGLPIVTTNVPGCKDVVREGENGYLVPVKDCEALADALEKLIANPLLRQEMGLASRKIAIEKYDSAKVIEETKKVYFPGSIA